MEEEIDPRSRHQVAASMVATMGRVVAVLMRAIMGVASMLIVKMEEAIVGTLPATSVFIGVERAIGLVSVGRRRRRTKNCTPLNWMMRRNPLCYSPAPQSSSWRPRGCRLKYMSTRVGCSCNSTTESMATALDGFLTPEP
jgi:hypothetical protein